MTVYLNLELTDRCNLRCRMCGQAQADQVHDVPETFMSWETWRELLEHLEGFRDDVSLCPHWLGEPTFHPEFNRFIQYAFERNRHNRLFREFKLHTNGVLFDHARASLLLDCADRSDQAPDTFKLVHFSVDAFHRETYRAIKRGDYRDQVYDNITRFLSLRAARGLEFPKVTLAFIVMPENIGEVTEFVAHWRHLLGGAGEPVDLVGDWPSGLRDAVYLRRLNQQDQEAADRLHREALEKVGLIPRGAAWSIAEQSF